MSWNNFSPLWRSPSVKPSNPLWLPTGRLASLFSTWTRPLQHTVSCLQLQPPLVPGLLPCFLSHSGAFLATFGRFWALQGHCLRHPTPVMGTNRSGWMPPYCFNCFPGNLNLLDPSEPTKLLFEPFWSTFANSGPFWGNFGPPGTSFGYVPKSLIGPTRWNWCPLVGKVSLL